MFHLRILCPITDIMLSRMLSRIDKEAAMRMEAISVFIVLPPVAELPDLDSDHPPRFHNDPENSTVHG
jgi:hypothetical protein